MSKVQRLGVSVDTELIRKFDRLVAGHGYRSRSLAISDLLRQRMIEEEWKAGNKKTAGTLTIVYSHRTRELTKALTAIQHNHHRHIIASTHVHLDAHNCLEVLVLRGKAARIRAIADRLIATRGVKHGKLTMTTIGKHLP